jgi:exonuclease III
MSAAKRKKPETLTDQPIIPPKKSETTQITNNWKITTINVRGLNDSFKTERLFEYLQENDITMTGITETWLAPRSIIRDHQDQYITYTTIPNEKNYFGTGVGIIIKKELDKHIYKKNTFEDRGIYIDMAFKRNTKLRIITIYNPANASKDLITRANLHDWLIHAINEATNHKMFTIVMGDFNATHDPILDTNKFCPPKSPNMLFETLTSFNFIDTFRSIHPSKKEFTWVRNGAGRRLDYIWMSPHFSNLIIDSYTENTSTIIDSDHKFVTTSLDPKNFLLSRPTNHKHEVKTFINCKESTPKQWSNFKKETEKNLPNLIQHSQHPSPSTLWNKIQDIITKAMFTNLKKTKQNKVRRNFSKSLKNSKQTEKIKTISKIYKKYIQWAVNPHARTPSNKEEILRLTAVLNKHNIELLTPTYI